MINQINGVDNCNSHQSSVDLELLEALLEPEDETYPWNLIDSESEEYFNTLEQQFECDDLFAEELTTRANDFYQSLDQIWSQVSYSKTDRDEQPSKSIKVSLNDAFAAFIPANLLDSIADKAEELINLEKSAGEKLVECVQGLLPNWGTDDLLVLSRPFAYSMRSNQEQSQESIIKNIENREWSSLSEIEQAKVSLAIAQYTLKELSNLEK